MSWIWNWLIILAQAAVFLGLLGWLLAQLRNHTVRAIFKRNVLSYFSGVLGYLFIVVFVVVGAFLAFNAMFFTNNQANLDQLTDKFPMLLLFLVPAITMSAWADERKLATDELLFTLPATDGNVLVGKYLAVLAVYTIALVFSLTHVFALALIGNPDPGLVLTTYFGYWLAGAALLSAGMFASVLTSSTTVAFVLGTVICAIPVFVTGVTAESVQWLLLLGGGSVVLVGIVWLTAVGSRKSPSAKEFRAKSSAGGVTSLLAGQALNAPVWCTLIGLVAFVPGLVLTLAWRWGHLNGLRDAINSLIQGVSLPEQLRDFGYGIIPFSGLWYFVGLTVLMLYLNLVFISRRHWSGSQAANMGLHFSVRTVCLAVIVIGLNVLASFYTLRMDFTSEGLYSLSPTTRATIANVSPSRPISIQAFISPEVPREYVSTRKQLIGLLRQYGQLAGGNIDVRIVDVEPFSEQVEEATLFGIKPTSAVSERDGRRYEETVYLGAVVSTSYDEVVIPFFGAGSLAEYELTRSIRTVSNAKRPTVGVLTTDANINAPSSEWRIVTELKKQYQVDSVAADAPIDTSKYDVLIAALPSSLTAGQMKNLVDYIEAKKPTLLFDDPFPLAFSSMFGVSNAPRQPKPRPGGMFGMGGPPPEPKADNGKATALLNALGIAWDNGTVVWDSFNPHPEFGEIPAEFLFIKSRKGIASAINPKSPITGGLQELLAAYSGTVMPTDGSRIKFDPLLRTGVNSGALRWEEFTEDSFDPSRMQATTRVRSQIPHVMDDASHTVAAQLTGGDKGINVVYVADVDLVSDWFFEQRERFDIQRERGETGMQLDNVTFVLNAVDVLAGDNTFLDLRKRRAESRTLKRVEELTSQLVTQRAKAEQEADQEAKDELQRARDQFANKRKELEENKSLDPRTVQITLDAIRDTEEQRLAVMQVNVERKKKEKIDRVKSEIDRQVKAVESRIRYLAVGIPPIPAILMGLFVFATRLVNERRNIAADRMVRRE